MWCYGILLRVTWTDKGRNVDVPEIVRDQVHGEASIIDTPTEHILRYTGLVHTMNEGTVKEKNTIYVYINTIGRQRLKF